MMVGNRAKTAYGFTHRLWAVGSAANLLRQRLDKFGPVFRAFFAVEHPNALEEGRDELAADPAWRECLITWGAAYR